MPVCGFNPTMLKGLVMFAQGLFVQAQKRAKEERISLDAAYAYEVNEMSVFLAALDERYEELKKHLTVDQAMRRLVEWGESWTTKTEDG